MSGRDLDHAPREARLVGIDAPAPARHIAQPSEVEIWAEQTVDQALKSRRVAWIAAGALILVCAAQAAAIAIMLPLKEVVPYVVTVDRQTGYVETTRALTPGALAEDEAVVHSLLAQYVVARETFDAADYKARYRLVTLWSHGQAREDYIAAYQPGTPQSILPGLRPDTRIAVSVKRVTLSDQGGARVDYEVQRQSQGMAPTREDRAATIAFRFSGAPMRMEDRLANPLGFQVTAFRTDQVHAAAASPAPLVSPTPIPTPAQAIVPAKKPASPAPAPVESAPPSPQPAPDAPPLQNPPQ
jgi:type IV secretion system protein VirB8